jgi:hypothetical protein
MSERMYQILYISDKHTVVGTVEIIGRSRKQAMEKAIEDIPNFIDAVSISCDGIRKNIKINKTELINLQTRIDVLEDKLQQITNWCDAYPVESFPEPDLEEVEYVLKSKGFSIGEVTASISRHVLGGIKRIIDESEQTDISPCPLCGHKPAVAHLDGKRYAVCVYDLCPASNLPLMDVSKWGEIPQPTRPMTDNELKNIDPWTGEDIVKVDDK